MQVQHCKFLRIDLKNVELSTYFYNFLYSRYSSGLKELVSYCSGRKELLSNGSGLKELLSYCSGRKELLNCLVHIYHLIIPTIKTLAL